MPPSRPSTRRRFLGTSSTLLASVGLSVGASAVRAAVPGARTLAMRHSHTGEQVRLVYAVDDLYVPDALSSLNHFLRDHYSGEAGRMDPLLFDVMKGIEIALGRTCAFEIISGYRCASTNEMLRETRGGGVARRSLHMDGKAIDLRVDGLALSELRDAALSLQAGGVGFYPREQFVHIDTGRVRRW